MIEATTQQVAAPPRLRDWIGVLAMGTGLFMAIMDVQIVTSSLTQIQGGLSASADEIAWVQTSYLIADVVMVPLSGMLSRLLSTRVLFATAALGFTGASVLCATASSLGQMIVFRAMQGFSGGAMMPLVWPVIYAMFRGRQLATLIAIISVILSMSSTLGPTLGGYLTDTFSWHWLFLVNILPGIAVAVTVWLTIDIDKPELSLLRHFDLRGLMLMALFLGCLQYALQEGPRWDWLADKTIRAAVVVSAIASVFFFWRVLTYHQPIVDVRAFMNRNFALGTFFTFTIGIGMYGTTYLVPLFLAQVRGYSALQIGLTVIVVGLVTMVMSPLSAFLARKMDLRLMLSIGIGLFAVSMYLTARLTNQSSFWELFVPQAVRGLGLICCYLPANLIALGSLPTEQDEERRRALQSESRSGRRHRVGDHRHLDEPTAPFSLEPADRRHQPGAPGGAAIPRCAQQPPRFAHSRRHRSRNDQDARQSGAARSAGHDLQRRIDADRRRVCRRPFCNAASSASRAPPRSHRDIDVKLVRKIKRAGVFLMATARRMPWWAWAWPFLAWVILAAAAFTGIDSVLAAAAGTSLVLTVFAAVYHAEVVAHRVGEPFGTLVLAVAVTVIEVALIVSVMIGGGGDKSGLARDTVFAAVMIICNGLVGSMPGCRRCSPL